MGHKSNVRGPNEQKGQDLVRENKDLRTKITRLEKFIMDQDKMYTILKDSVSEKIEARMQDILSENIDSSTNNSRLQKTIQNQDVLVKKPCEVFKEQYDDFHVKQKAQSTPSKDLVKNPMYEDISDDEMDESDLEFNSMKAEIKELKKVIEIKDNDLVNVKKEHERYSLKLINKYGILEDKVAQLENENSRLSKLCEDYRKQIDSSAKSETRNKKLRAKNNNNKKVILDLKHKNTKLTKACEDLKLQNEILIIPQCSDCTKNSLKLKEIEMDRDQSIKSLQGQIVNYKRENTTLEATKNFFKTWYDQVKEDLDKIKANRREIKKRLDEIVAENKALNSKYDDLLTKNTELETKISDLQVKLKCLGKENHNLEAINSMELAKFSFEHDQNVYTNSMHYVKPEIKVEPDD